MAQDERDVNSNPNESTALASEATTPRVLRCREALRPSEKLILQEKDLESLSDPASVKTQVELNQDKSGLARQNSDGRRKTAPAAAPSTRTLNPTSKPLRTLVLDENLRPLYGVFRAAERCRDVVGRQEAFARLVDELFRKRRVPTLILSHRNFGEEMQFRCAWVIDSEESIEGWFAGNLLRDQFPAFLADYLTRLHVPDRRATYRLWTRQPSPTRILEFPPRPTQKLQS